MKKLNILLIGLALAISSACQTDPYELRPGEQVEYPEMLISVAAWDMMIWRVSDRCYADLFNYDVIIKDRPITCNGRTKDSIAGCTTYDKNEIAIASDLKGTAFKHTMMHEAIHALADCEQGALAVPYHYDERLWTRISTEEDPYKKRDNENVNNVETITERMLKRDKEHPVIIEQEE